MARTKSLHVLLAGENDELARALRVAGHEVEVGEDAMTALNAAEASSVDVAVIDLEEFRGEPFALAKAIRGATFGYKPLFVAMTRDLGDQVEMECRDAGIDLMLVKPVSPSLLVGFVGRLGAVVAEYESFDPVI